MQLPINVTLYSSTCSDYYGGGPAAECIFMLFIKLISQTNSNLHNVVTPSATLVVIIIKNFSIVFYVNRFELSLFNVGTSKI
jgi:hypothetical protein